MNFLDINNFFFNLPLYSPIQITSENGRDFLNLISYDGKIDGYNPMIKENTTFEVYPLGMENKEYFLTYGGINKFRLVCTRKEETFTYFVHYDSIKKILQKIGQYPSIATFHIHHIKKYDKVLSNDKLKEFTRGIGLAANGVGIGSFVYLRRIFEDLIEEAHKKAIVTNGWNDAIFKKERMPEKIEMLKDYLPSFLVENKNLYGILSVGVHSLKEEECLAHFDTVKVGIELILDEKLEKLLKEKKLIEAKKKIQDLNQKIKPKN